MKNLPESRHNASWCFSHLGNTDLPHFCSMAPEFVRIFYRKSKIGNHIHLAEIFCASKWNVRVQALAAYRIYNYIIVSLLWFYDNFSCDHRIQVASLPTGFRALNYPCCTPGVNDLGVSALWLFLMWFLQQQNWTWITSLRFFVLMNIKFNYLWHSFSRVD